MTMSIEVRQKDPSELIVIKQLPVIEEHLQAISLEIQAQRMRPWPLKRLRETWPNSGKAGRTEQDLQRPRGKADSRKKGHPSSL